MPAFKEERNQRNPGFRRLLSLGICTPVILFLIYSLTYLNRTGLNYDETLFVNAALGGITPDFVYKKIFDIPVMIFPYAGALKAYLYYPLFKLFGVNVYSIRLPAIFIAGLTLIIWYKNGKDIFKDASISLLFLFLISTDPAYIIQSKFDFGPVVLQNFFIALAFYAFFSLTRHQSLAYFSLLLVTMTLGLYNKLNFIWFIAAFSLAAITFYPEKITRLYKQHHAVMTCLVSVFAILLMTVFVFLIVPALKNINIGTLMLAPLYNKCIYMFKLYLDTLNGSERYFFLFFDPLPAPTWVNIIEGLTLMAWLLVFISTLVLRISNRHYQRYNRFILFIALIFALEFIQIIVTPQARNSEHLMILWPLQHILFLLALSSIISLCRNTLSHLFLVIPVIVLASQLYTDQLYLYAFSNPNAYKNQMWTPAIDTLSQYINQHIHEYDEIISIDFGPNNQIFALANNDNDRKKFHEIYYLLTDYPPILQYRNYVYPQFDRDDHTNEAWLYTTYFKGKNDLIVMYHDKESIQGVTAKFYAFAIKYRLDLTFVTSIQDATGRSMFTLLSASEHN